jgi:gliding motility-associated lipoprotein GldH
MQTRFWFGILVVFLMLSCNQNKVFDRYTSVKNSWHKNQRISYDFTIKDSLQPQNLFIKIRTTEDYKYNNLFLIVDLKYPNGKIEKDTLEYKMAKPNGAMLGKGLMSIKEHKLWYRGHLQPFVFSEVGSYTVTISHAMRALDEVLAINSLSGVLDIGFCVENLE